MKAYSKTDPKDRKIKIVPLEEFWTKERRERRMRELGPVKGEREFLKFMRETMAQQAAVKVRAETAAKGER